MFFSLTSASGEMRIGNAPAGLFLHMPVPEPTPPGMPEPRPPSPVEIDPIEDPPQDGEDPMPPVQDPPTAPYSDVPERLGRAAAFAAEDACLRRCQSAPRLHRTAA